MASKRTILKPNSGVARYIRRDVHGRFTGSQVDVGRSLTADRRQHAKADNPGGQGDRGDRQRPS